MNEDSTATPLLRPSAGPVRAVVTGGAGFVGSHLTVELLGRGYHVHVVDDLSTGSLANLPAPGGDSRLSVRTASVSDAAVARQVCADADIVFHLAGVVGVRLLADSPLSVMQRNLDCTTSILAAASASGVPVLFSSSSEVYGEGPVPFRENAPVRPGVTEGRRGGYACAKAMCEWLAFGHAEQQGLRAVVARLFNTVGPRQSGEGGMVLPRFERQAVANEPITVYGSGEQTRCFAHVTEVARALADLAEASGCAGRVFNVGSRVETTVGDLATMVREIAGSDSPIVRMPFDEVFPRGFADPPRRLPSLERLQRAIGWVPRAPLERIVAELVELARIGELIA